MENTISIPKNNIKIDNVLLCMVYLAPLLLVLGPSYTYISSTIIIGSSLILWGSNKIYYIFPVFIFFSNELLMPGGLSAFRVFSILLFLKMTFSKRLYVDKNVIIPFLVILLYSSIVITMYDYSLSIIIIFDLFLMILYISMFIRKNIISFFTYYVFGTVISCIYGWFMQALNISLWIRIDNQWVRVTRFVGSFPDPNYFGFFINIAIFTIIILGIFKNKNIKTIVLIFLYVSLLASLSITGFICNVLLLAVYMALTRKVKIRYILSVLVMGVLLIKNLDLLAIKNYPVISDLARRISSQLSLGTNKDLSAVTTGRFDIWKEHLDYYIQQPILKSLFGGNYVTDVGMEAKFDHVSHQAYIDMLLNYGLLGTVVMILFLFILTMKYLNNFLKTKKDEFLLLVFIKLIWVFYAFGLSMFPSWKFNLFFFL